MCLRKYLKFLVLLPARRKHVVRWHILVKSGLAAFREFISSSVNTVWKYKNFLTKIGELKRAPTVHYYLLPDRFGIDVIES